MGLFLVQVCGRVLIMWPRLHEMDVLVRLRTISHVRYIVLVRLRNIGIRTALKRLFRTTCILKYTEMNICHVCKVSNRK